MLELHQRHKTQYQQSQLETKMDSAYKPVRGSRMHKQKGICHHRRLSSSTRILDLLGLPTAEHQHSDGVPLCPAHYRFIHRTLHESDHTYKEIKCTVCSTVIKKNNIRHCPNPVIIEEHYRTHTDFTCSITTDDPICITCYKSHLMILQDKSVSRDEDLRELLGNLEGRAQQQHSDTDVIEAAKIQLAITVGHALLQQDVMLLPEAYRMFCSTSARLSTARGIPTNSNLPTKRAIQSYLLSALGHHLSYTCKQRRTGILLYRTGGDLLITITKLLEKAPPQITYHMNIFAKEVHSQTLKDAAHGLICLLIFEVGIGLAGSRLGLSWSTVVLHM